MVARYLPARETERELDRPAAHPWLIDESLLQVAKLVERFAGPVDAHTADETASRAVLKGRSGPGRAVVNVKDTGGT